MGMKLGKWLKFHKLHSFYQTGEIELIFTLRAAVSEIQANFQNCHIGHETWPLANVPEVAYVSNFNPRGVEIELIFALQTAVSEIWADFQNCHIWA